jgi:hypothetical protein
VDALHCILHGHGCNARKPSKQRHRRIAIRKGPESYGKNQRMPAKSKLSS